MVTEKACPRTDRNQSRLLKLLENPGSSNGRTPALTSEETHVRIVARDAQNLVGPALLEAAKAPDQQPRDLAP